MLLSYLTSTYSQVFTAKEIRDYSGASRTMTSPESSSSSTAALVSLGGLSDVILDVGELRSCYYVLRVPEV